jgi:hypothetical protein
MTRKPPPRFDNRPRQTQAVDATQREFGPEGAPPTDGFHRRVFVSG